MYKALIIEKDIVTVLDVVNWNNYGKDYIKLITDMKNVFMCSSSHLRILINDDNLTDEELVNSVVNRKVNIKRLNK